MLFYQLENDRGGLLYLLDAIRFIRNAYAQQYGEEIHVVLNIDVNDVEEESKPYDEPPPSYDEVAGHVTPDIPITMTPDHHQSRRISLAQAGTPIETDRTNLHVHRITSTVRKRQPVGARWTNRYRNAQKRRGNFTSAEDVRVRRRPM